MKKKKLITAIKQATAGLLASAMVLTGVPLGGITAQAAVLPENTTLMPNPTEETPNDTSPHPDYSGYKVTVISGGTNGYYTFGNSESTAYAFGKSTPMGNTSPQYNTNSLVGVPTGTEPPITFNIGAITSDDAAKGKTKGYYDNYSGGSFSPMNQPTVKSAYKNNWWFTYYGFGGSMFDSPVPTTTVDPEVTFDGTGAPLSASAPAATYKSFLPSRGNGGITEIDTPNSTGKVEVRTELMPTDDNENLLLKYTVYNNSTTAQDFWIGNETDTMMYDTDSVPITISVTICTCRIKMVMVMELNMVILHLM